MRYVSIGRRIAVFSSMFLGSIVVTAGGACNATLSVYPLYDSKDGAAEPRVVGEWRGQWGDREMMAFRAKVGPPENGVYRVTLTDDGRSDNRRLGLPSEYYARVIKIENHLYLDVTPKRVVDLSAPEKYNPLLVSGHLILLCSLERNSVLLRAISARRIREISKRDGIEVPMLRDGDANPVLTVSTERLRSVILKYGDALFEEEGLRLDRANDEK